MDLKTYAASKRITLTEIAEILGIKRSHLYHMISGQKRFSKRVAAMLEDVTEGSVTYFSLRGERRPGRTVIKKRAKKKK